MVRRVRTSRKRKRIVQEIEKPWCYYCDRSFENEQVLHTHQRAKHFTCPHCPRKFALAVSLSMHMFQTHNDPLNAVPNSLPDRSNPKLPISGMNGIPIEVVIDRFKKMYHQERDEMMRHEIARRITDLGGELKDSLEDALLKASKGLHSETLENNYNEPLDLNISKHIFTLKQSNPFLSKQDIYVHVFGNSNLSMEEQRMAYCENPNSFSASIESPVESSA